MSFRAFHFSGFALSASASIRKLNPRDEPDAHPSASSARLRTFSGS